MDRRNFDGDVVFLLTGFFVKQMKVLIIGNGSIDNDHRGGYWINRHTGNFLLKLKHHGIEVTFCDFEVCRTGFLHDFDLSASEIPALPVSTQGLFRKILGIASVFRRVHRVDLVYVFCPGTLSKIVSLYCLLIGKPLSLYVRGGKFGHSILDRWVIGSAKFALTVSPLLRERIEKLCRKVDTIRPMTDLKVEHLSASKPWTAFPTVIRFLFVGRIEESKGVFDLINAAEHLRSQGFQIQLRIVGDGPSMAAARELIQQKHLIQSIELVGQLNNFDELLAEYGNADAFVFPTHHEGFPRVLLEAMTKSCPVFTTMVGGIPGIMKNNENCFEIPVKDPLGIANTILRSMNNVLDWKRIADSGNITAKKVLFERAEHHELFLGQCACL